MIRPGIHEPGHCKATAERIRQDAEQIVERLANREQGKTIAAEYGCDHVTLRKHLTAVIGTERWRQLIYHRGPKVGTVHFGRPRKLKEEQVRVAEEPGTHCYICRTPITSDTLKCPNPNCGALQYG